MKCGDDEPLRCSVSERQCYPSLATDKMRLNATSYIVTGNREQVTCMVHEKERQEIKVVASTSYSAVDVF